MSIDMLKGKKFVGITSCPTGIAHTYMAAETLEKFAEANGFACKIETQGSIGSENELTAQEIIDADAVIIAADKNVEMERFYGKKVVFAGTKKAIDDPESLFVASLEAPEIQGAKSDGDFIGGAAKSGPLKHLMNGVSHMLPMVVVGGLFIALSLAFGGEVTPDGIVIPETNQFWLTVNQIGVVAFTLMIPLFAGYVAVSIGDRPALVPAMIGGWIANNGSFYDSPAGTGFLGAILVGFAVGYFVKWFKTIPVPKAIMPIMPIIVIPIVATLFISILFIGVVGKPIAELINVLNVMLTNLSGGSKIILGFALGAMLAFDMGGPVNKTAFFFGVASIPTNPEIMGAVACAGAVPPLTMAFSTWMNKKIYSNEEREAGIAAFVMGLIGISEGAIPFAAADPLRVIPTIMFAGGLAGAAGLAIGITCVVPHTGPIVGVLGAVNLVIPYFIIIFVASLIGGIIITYWKGMAIKKAQQQG